MSTRLLYGVHADQMIRYHRALVKLGDDSHGPPQFYPNHIPHPSTECK
jgi:hypothetical protein